MAEYIRADEYRIETPVVYMRHAAKGKEAVLAGTIHVGLPQYYREIFQSLGGCGRVLYEKLKKSEQKNLISRLLFLYKPDLTGFYRQIAKRLSENTERKIVSRAGRILDMHNITYGREPYLEKARKLASESSLVAQQDGIPYDYLPENWINSDISIREAEKAVGVLSVFNLMAGVARVAPFFAKKMADFDDFIYSMLIEDQDSEELDPLSLLNYLREDRVMEDFVQAESENDRIGIIYGLGHISELERKLGKQGYKRERIEFSTIIRKNYTTEEMEQMLFGDL